MGFGTTPEAWWEILQTVQGWTCVEVPRAGAAMLGALIENHRQVSIRYYQDIYHTLEKPAERIAHPLVRQLTLSDADIVAAAPAAVRGGGFGSVHTLLYRRPCGRGDCEQSPGGYYFYFCPVKTLCKPGSCDFGVLARARICYRYCLSRVPAGSARGTNSGLECG